MEAEQRAIKSLFKKLNGAGSNHFPKHGQKLLAPDKKGVYVIYGPKGKALHVGSTPRAKKGLAQRLRNHLQGQSSFTKKFFAKSEKRGPQLRNGYSYAFVIVPNDRRRALLEAYAIGSLCPKHIGHGAKKTNLKLNG
jgi:hypothetical protein